MDNQIYNDMGEEYLTDAHLKQLSCCEFGTKRETYFVPVGCKLSFKQRLHKLWINSFETVTERRYNNPNKDILIFEQETKYFLGLPYYKRTLHIPIKK